MESGSELLANPRGTAAVGPLRARLPDTEPTALLDRLVLAIYVLAWAALVPRFVVALLMAAFRLSGYPAAYNALYHPLAWTDFVTPGRTCCWSWQ